MAYAFAPVLHKAGSDNMGGMSTMVYVAPHNIFKTFPSFAKETDTELTGKFEFRESDQGFVGVSASYKSNGLKSSPVGDIDSRCAKVEGEFFHPGADESAALFARLVQNTPVVIIVRDNEGKYRVVGDPINPAIVTVEHDTGKSPEDRKGFTIKYEAYSSRLITTYKPTDAANPFPTIDASKTTQSGGSGSKP